MKQKSNSTVADRLVKDSSSVGDTAGDVQSKRADLQKKCQDLIASMSAHSTLYGEILAALAESHQKTLDSLKQELLQLETAIPGLDKKSIKRLKLAGTLTSIGKQSQKIQIKAVQKRKKDFHKLDDFVMDSFRTLRAANRKITAE